MQSLLRNICFSAFLIISWSTMGQMTPTVETVIIRTATKYGLGGTYVKNEVHIFYDNGDIYSNPTMSLENIDIVESKRKHPRKWNTWEKKGEILHITKTYKGKSYDWKKYFKVRKGESGFTLDGIFHTSDPFGGGSVINASAVAFDSQGRFSWKTVKGGNTDWKPIYTESKSAGTYEIDGYTIKLNYNNGTSESFFFGLYPKDDKHFVIGSSHFIPAKK